MLHRVSSSRNAASSGSGAGPTLIAMVAAEHLFRKQQPSSGHVRPSWPGPLPVNTASTRTSAVLVCDQAGDAFAEMWRRLRHTHRDFDEGRSSSDFAASAAAAPRPRPMPLRPSSHAPECARAARDAARATATPCAAVHPRSAKTTWCACSRSGISGIGDPPAHVVVPRERLRAVQVSERRRRSRQKQVERQRVLVPPSTAFAELAERTPSGSRGPSRRAPGPAPWQREPPRTARRAACACPQSAGRFRAGRPRSRPALRRGAASHTHPGWPPPAPVFAAARGPSRRCCAGTGWPRTAHTPLQLRCAAVPTGPRSRAGPPRCAPRRRSRARRSSRAGRAASSLEALS